MNGVDGAGGVEVPGGANEALRSPRWRVACINWSHAGAPKAVAYITYGEGFFDRYFNSWAEAVDWADGIARRTK